MSRLDLIGKRRISPHQMRAYNELTPRETYQVLEFYYYSNGLYALLQDNNGDDTIWTDGMLGLRNPCHRVVEFHVGHIWPGNLPDALPITTENTAIVSPIQQVWKWSGWSAKKQVFSRWFATFGDGFIKVAKSTDGQRVYFQNLKPEYVSEIDADERDFLTYCRIDVPQTRRENGKTVSYWHTEVWDKPSNSYRTWENRRGPDTPLEQLGPAKEVKSITDFGFDFIPIVHAKFQDAGNKRGEGAFVHALDKIDEANRMATRLHQILYRYQEAVWAIRADDKDPSGRPLPAPRLNVDGTTSVGSVDMAGGTKVVYLPGMSKLDLLIPDIAYDEALNILKAHLQELEGDLPELAYYRLRERSGELTGRAARILLSDLIDKALEARGNAEAALVRADEMALTIGAAMGLFNGLGAYENGDFDHTFQERDVVSSSEFEKAETMQAYTGAGVPVDTAARWTGRSDADIEQMGSDREADSKRQARSLGQALVEQQRRFDAGQMDEETTGDDTSDNSDTQTERRKTQARSKR